MTDRTLTGLAMMGSLKSHQPSTGIAAGVSRDLELTKACADAMGLHLLPAYPKVHLLHSPRDNWNGLMYSADGGREYLFIESGAYDPLHDDAQCFALVKRFNLFVRPWADGTWSATGKAYSFSPDLNRAIVECVAKLAGVSR